MASITMTASFLGNTCISGQSPVNRRRVVMAKAARVEAQEIDASNADNTRRNLMVAATAAAITTIASGRGIAIADVEPKAGSPEAKKKYAPICVTMPTAKICHK